MAWLYKQAKSENWWIGYRANGKQFLRSTKTPDRKLAEMELAKVDSLYASQRAGTLTQEVYEALTGKATPRKTLHAEARDWLAECGTGTKPGTLRRYEGILKDLMTHLGCTEKGPLLSEISTEEIRRHLTERLKQASASTVNIERKILRMFFKRATDNGTLKGNPILPIKGFKGDTTGEKRRAFTIEELGLLHSKAPDDFWRYMIVGGFYTGLRMGDLASLDWRAVDLRENVLHVTTRKTGKPVHVPMAPKLRQLLASLHAKSGRPTRGPVWPERAAGYAKNGAGALSNEFYELLSECGLVAVRENKRGKKKGRSARRETNPLSFHCVRHSFVTFLKITGANSSVAKELAGHSSDMMNNLYTHLPAETLAGAIAQLPEVAT